MAEDEILKQPALSVITVTYNLLHAGRRETFLRALNAVQAQKDVALEHLIHDGASSDGTVDFITEAIAGLPNVRFFSEPDRGIYDAMNKASAKAEGEALVFLNSDDAFASDDVLGLAMNTLHQRGAGYVYGATAQGYGNGHWKVWEPNLKSILQRMPFAHNSIVIKKEVFERLGGHDPEMKVSADYDLILRMVAAGYEGADVGMPISLYWDRGASADVDQMGKEYAETWRRFFADFELDQPPTAEECRGFFDKGSMPVGFLLKLYRATRGRADLRRAIRHSLAKAMKRSLQPWRFR